MNITPVDMPLNIPRENPVLQSNTAMTVTVNSEEGVPDLEPDSLPHEETQTCQPTEILAGKTIKAYMDNVVRDEVANITSGVEKDPSSGLDTSSDEPGHQRKRTARKTIHPKTHAGKTIEAYMDIAVLDEESNITSASSGLDTSSEEHGHKRKRTARKTIHPETHAGKTIEAYMDIAVLDEEANITSASSDLDTSSDEPGYKRKWRAGRTMHTGSHAGKSIEAYMDFAVSDEEANINSASSGLDTSSDEPGHKRKWRAGKTIHTETHTGKTIEAYMNIAVRDEVANITSAVEMDASSDFDTSSHEPGHKCKRGGGKTIHPYKDLVRATDEGSRGAKRQKKVILEQQPTLRYRVLMLLGLTNAEVHLEIPPASTPDEIATILTAERLWCVNLIRLFQRYPTTKMHIITGDRIPHSNGTPLLQPFCEPRTFTALTDLSLANLPIQTGELDCIRLLPELVNLDLTNTGVDTRALFGLHRSLRTLNLTNNLGVDDGTLVPLYSQLALKKIYLEGTSFTMWGLRNLVDDYKSGLALPAPRAKPKLHIASIPLSCTWYFQSTPQYAVDIPAGPGYIKDPTAVARLGVGTLLKNLKVHHEVNKRISLGGSKMEMAARLKEYLWRRKMDGRVRVAMTALGEEVAQGFWLAVGKK